MIGPLKLILAAGLYAVNDATCKNASARLLNSLGIRMLQAEQQIFLIKNRRWIMPAIDLLGDHGISYPAELDDVGYWLSEITKKRSHFYDALLSQLKVMGSAAVPFKGSDMRRYARDPARRFMADLDILSPSEKLGEVEAVLKSQGFRQGYPDMDREDTDLTGFWIDPLHDESDRWIRENGHELHPYFRFDRYDDLKEAAEAFIAAGLPDLGFDVHGTRYYLKTSVDVHFNIASEFDFGDISFETRGNERQVSTHVYLLFYAGRVYYETILLNRPDFKSFVDFLTLLYAEKNSIDWEALRRLSSKYKAHAPLFYCLSHALNLNDSLNLSGELRWFADNLRERRDLDLGDFMPRLGGFFSPALLIH